MSQKIEIAFHFRKELHKNFGWFQNKFWGNTSVKRISFVVGWVGGILCFVHTPVLRCPYTRTTLGLRLRFARISVNAHFWVFIFLMASFWFLCAPFFCVLSRDFFVGFCALFSCFIFFRFLPFFCAHHFK